MFWRYNLITGSCIETLLDKENVTLKELMDEEDILQECKAQTKKLLDFMVKPDILDNTVSMIINEPDPEEDERQRYRYANRACELLTFDNPQVYDALTSDEVLLKKLYNYLDTDETLNPLLASFFSKTMGLLIMKKTEVMYNFLKDTEFVSLILKHFDTSAIMDLLLRFLTIENNDMRTTIIKWLNEKNLIQQLISRINLEYNEDFNCNASHALCDIIKMSREHLLLLQDKADPNPLLDTIESVEAITELLNNMFNDVRKEHAVVNGIYVLLQLLSFKKQGPSGIQLMPQNSTEQLLTENAPTGFSLCKSNEEQLTPLDSERQTRIIFNIMTAIIPRLKDFHNLLINPPSKPAIKLTVGCLDPPLGNCRLEIAHLITALLHTNNHLVNVELAELQTIIILMDTFFKYPYNNFLHTQVEQTMGRIFSNAATGNDDSVKVHPLLDQILLQYKITEKILECFQEEHERSPGVHRKGYMGHITKIANHIAQNFENGVNSTLIKDKIKELPEEHQKCWEEFANDRLTEINKKNKVYAISGPSLQSVHVDDDSVDFREHPFGKDSAEHLTFSDYQMREMTSNFVDQFGFNDDEFGDNEDSLIYAKSSMNQMSQNFQISESSNMRSAEVFEEVCRTKMNPEGDAVLWADNQYNAKFSSCFRLNRSVEENNSSDSDEESQVFEAESTPIVIAAEEMKMDVDNQEAIFDGVPMDVAPAAISNPWESTEPSSTSDDQGNWADFSNFASFGSSEQSDLVTSSVSAMETSDTSCAKFFTNPNDMPSSKADSTGSYDVIVNRLCNASPEKKEDVFLESASSEKVQPLQNISGINIDPKSLNSESKSDSTSLFDEASSSNSPQNGPV